MTSTRSTSPPISARDADRQRLRTHRQRRWLRGLPLADAPTVFEGERGDVGVGAWVEHDPQCFSEGFVRSIAFYRGETWRVADGMPERRVRLEVPPDAEASIVGRWLVVRLRTAWDAGKTRHEAGSLIAIDAASFIAGAREFSTFFAPTPSTALESWVATRSGIVIHMLDNVRSRVLRLSHAHTGWVRDEIDLPGAGTATITAVDRHRCDGRVDLVSGFPDAGDAELGVARRADRHHQVDATDFSPRKAWRSSSSKRTRPTVRACRTS